MPIKAKYNGSYKDITDLMNVDESIDYVLAKTSSSYKRVYTATRSIEDAPPTTFKSIKSGANLTDYRIYGQTSRNLFDGELYIGYYRASDGQLITDPSASNFYKYVHSNLIPCMPQTTYTLKYVCTYTNKFVIFTWYSGNNFITSTNFTNIDAHTLTVTAPLSATKFGITISGIDNDPSTQTTIAPSDISNIMLNSGSTPLPYEPYGESVGDRTANLWNGVLIDGVYTDNTLNNVGLATGVFKSLSVYLNAGTYTLSFSTNVNVVRYIEKDVLYTENLAINVSSYTFTLSNATSIGFSFRDTASSTTQWDNNINVMLNAGSSPLPYEPYGYKVPMTVEGKNLFDYDTITHGYRIQWSTGANYADETAIMSDFISVSENSTYATDTKLYWLCYDANKQYIGAWDGSDIVKSGVDAINSMTAISPCKFIRILSFSRKITPISSATMLNCGSTALPYEPYHAPITTSIYLPEPIKMVGDEAEYIEYGSQKMYRIGADDLDVTLPALPTLTGTNVLSVGTEVQPSKIDIAGHIKTISGGS